MDARDVFISHASDDNDVARPLAEELVRAGVSVWFDEYEIEIGDDLREKIDEGLRKSKFGVVILSKSFFATKKTWTRRELSGLTAAEDSDGQRRTLPIWHKLDQADVAKYSPIVAGLVAMKTQEHSISDIAAAIKSKVRPT